MMTSERLDELSNQVLKAALRVHTVLGPGLLESAYTACLAFELRKAGLNVRTQVPIPVVYEGVLLEDVGYRLDLLVEDELVIEMKSVAVIAPVHLMQLVSYLKLSNRRIGLLLNFNVEHMKDGIYRRVRNF